MRLASLEEVILWEDWMSEFEYIDATGYRCNFADKVTSSRQSEKSDWLAIRHGHTCTRLVGAILVLVLSLLTAGGSVGCAKLYGSKGFDSEGYNFPGIERVSANSDGTFTLTWEAAPAKQSPMYAVYVKQGTDADPGASSVSFNFSQPWKRVSDNSVTTDNLLFNHNTCFAVKLELTGYVDSNVTQMCTEHERFYFEGIASLGVLQGGKFALAWAAVPDREVEFSLYTRKANISEQYNFSADPILKTADTLAETKAYPLNETRCFLVRFKSKVSNDDANQKEICSSDDGVADFAGIDKITSNISGQATLSWIKSVNPSVSGYTIYQGNNFQLKIGTAAATENSFVATGLPPGEHREFGIRAYDKYGREDDNTKTLSTIISTAATIQGEFPGCIGNTILDSSSIRIDFRWPTGASRMAVVRDGVVVYDTGNTTDTSYTDVGLSNARSYNYKCYAVINSLNTEGTASYNLRPLNQNDLPPFPGCITATPLNENQIILTFAWPSFTGRTVTSMNLYRNGVLLRSETSNSVTSFVDSGLSEGQTAIYNCNAVVSNLDLAGSLVLTAQTLSVNPPAFAGLASALAYGTSGVRLNWVPAASNGAPVERYEVWGNPGSTLLTGGSPLQTLASTVQQATLANLGEELPYTYAVRACSPSGNCTWGTHNGNPVLSVSVTNASSVTKSYTRPDTGSAPNTAGATNVVMSGGAAQITAPWDASLGGVKKRHVYYRNITDSGAPENNETCLLNMMSAACYPGKKVFVVSDLAFPPTTLSVDGLTDGKSYTFILQDEDPAGNINQNMSAVTVSTGDLTPPVFGGGGTLSLGDPAETTLHISFSAVEAESLIPINNQGANNYLVYMSETDGAGTPSDPCAFGTLISPQIDASGYSAGQTVTMDISGKAPRKTYAVCVKARDSSGNVSSTTTRATPLITTPDTTAPEFDGIQSISYNAELSCIPLSWNESSASDLKEYKAILWKASDSDNKVTKTIAKPASSVCLSLSTDLGALGSLDNENVFAYMQACDTAAPPFGTQNCSANNETSAISRTIPDTIPPAHFGGITSVATSSPITSGAFSVNWSGPSNSDWSDYRGFKVYDVPCKRASTPCSLPSNGDLSLLRDCSCAANGCAEHLTTCQVSGLTPYGSYSVFVRAYDSSGNQTAIGTSPLIISARADDSQKPSFSSALSGVWVTASNATCTSTGNGVCLGWNEASDNQTNEAVITYKVYRKTDSTITFDGNNLPLGATLISTVTNALSHKDSAAELVGGTTYYYTVCAQDAATTANYPANAGLNCDKLVVNSTPPDLIAPNILNVSVDNLSPSIANPEWTLTWQLSDNLTNMVTARVYKIDTDPNHTTLPDGSGTPIYEQNIAATASTVYNLSKSSETGITGQHRRIAYLLTATDLQGNIGTATFAVNADLATPIAANITNMAEGGTLLSFAKEFTGTCDSTAGNSTTAALTPTDAGQVISTTCASSTLTLRAHFREGSGARVLTVTTTKLNGNTVSAARSFFFHKPCPTGYVGIPGKWSDDPDVTGLGNAAATANNPNAGLDPLRDFCLMKYPAKAATSNNGGQTPWEPIPDGFSEISGTNYWPESRYSGLFWGVVRHSNTVPIDRCKALNETFGLCSGLNCYSSFDNSSAGFRLITNTQWQVVARNVESNFHNWSGGSVGLGVMNHGFRDLDAIFPNLQLHYQTSESNTYYGRANKTQSRDDTNGYFAHGVNYGPYWTLGATLSGFEASKRTHELTTGANIWDLSGNNYTHVQENLQDLGISATALSASNNFAAFTPADKLILFGKSQSDALPHGGYWLDEATWPVRRGGTYEYGGVFQSCGGDWSQFCYSTSNAFRCSFVPEIASTTDTNAPIVSSVQRVNGSGTSVSNTPVTVSGGGFWNLAWTVFDAENTGTNANKIWVQVRRKFADVNSDFPTTSDPVYKEGFVFASLQNETAWEQNTSTGQFTRNDWKYVNYLITAVDPSGNQSSSTGAQISVYNTQSCPPGYIGVPEKNALDSDTTGLGNVNAFAGNNHKQLDPTETFCVMKYPAKIQSAGTTAAKTTVGGKFEPILDGNKSFSNDYTYTDVASFDAKIKFLPESRPAGTPWLRIDRNNALEACRAQQMQYFGTLPDTTTGNGFQLISNTQWQVMARNAEAVPSNWSNNEVGSGVLNIGHSDFTISATEAMMRRCIGCTAPNIGQLSVAHSISDANSYFGTGNTAGAAWHMLGVSPGAGTEQKRTHILSNGAVVWDISGNVLQWVLDNNLADRSSATADLNPVTGDMGVSDTARSATSGDLEYDAGTAVFTDSDILLFGGADGHTSIQNAGTFVGGSAGGVVRSGVYWDPISSAGLFRAKLDLPATTSTSNGIGFRCVFVP